jgi:hypothetical protein
MFVRRAGDVRVLAGGESTKCWLWRGPSREGLSKHVMKERQTRANKSLHAEMERAAANRACAIRRPAKLSWSREAPFKERAGTDPAKPL